METSKAKILEQKLEQTCIQDALLKFLNQFCKSAMRISNVYAYNMFMPSCDMHMQFEKSMNIHMKKNSET